MNAIQSCLELRERMSKIVVEELTSGKNEAEVSNRIISKLKNLEGVAKGGWYDPPPNGTSILFGQQSENYNRTRFDTLRDKKYWPSLSFNFEQESVGIIYASPFWANTGVIGDFGLTVYLGDDKEVKQHLVKCLNLVEDMAEFAEIGMAYGDISREADRLMADYGLTSDRTLLTNSPDSTGTNCGHTVPFADAEPNKEEKVILESANKTAVNKLISSKRVFINANVKERIPKTCAFTSELRLESLEDPNMPNVFFHLIVSFVNGKKKIVSNFNPLFKAIGMNYIKSKF